GLGRDTGAVGQLTDLHPRSVALDLPPDWKVYDASLQIELLHVPDCPLVDDVRVTLRGALADAGIDARVEEIEGDFASPTVRIDGVDVTGAEMCNAPAC